MGSPVIAMSSADVRRSVKGSRSPEGKSKAGVQALKKGREREVSPMSYYMHDSLLKTYIY